MQKYSGLSLDEMQKYAGSQYVKDFYYTLTTSMSKSGTLTPFTTTSTSPTNTPVPNSSSATVGNRSSGSTFRFSPMGEQGDFSVNGSSSESSLSDFVNGTSKVTSGQIFDFSTDDHSCIISSDLATFNSINVGDKITLANPNTATETYEFTVVGIYTNSASTQSTEGPRFSTSMDPANLIYTSYKSLKTVMTASTSVATTTTDSTTGLTNSTALREQVAGTYVLPDVASLDLFKADVTAMGLDSNYTVTSPDVTTFEQSLIPLKNLGDFATTLLLLVILIGGIILIVFNIFNIRERKFEVGVLTAIGMKKGKVALQFVIELFVVTFISIIIGTSIGAVVSVPTANMLLANQISTQQSQSTQQNQNFGRSQQGAPQGGFQGGFNAITRGNQNVSYVDQINAVMNFNVLLQLIGLGILLTLLSSAAGVIFALRYEPLKILANRA
jgi:putative ABC transport system permease protein